MLLSYLYRSQRPLNSKFPATPSMLLRSLQTSPRYQTLLPRALKSCTLPSQLYQIHAHMIKTGLDLSPFPVSKLLAAAVLISTPSYARSIFDRICDPNIFVFNTMLRGYSIVCSLDIQEAISIFNSLRARGISLDQFSFIATLKICARALASDAGSQIHGIVLRSGFEFFLNLRNTLIHFYCSCGQIRDAHQVFDEIPYARDSVSWSALMGGYLHLLQCEMVAALFGEMQKSGIEIGEAAVVSALSASIEAHRRIETLHAYCNKAGLLLALQVATAIATVYSRSGCMDSARKMFDEIGGRDVVLYNSMIDGYAELGLVEGSLALLDQMKMEGVKPNSATLVGLLSSCASSGVLVVGRRIHEHIKEEMKELDVVLGTALIDMYSKCGCLDDAINVFDQMRDKDVKSWTAMIVGFGVHGRAEAALRLLDEMEEKGVRPNEVTFLAALSACSHAGLLTEAKDCFKRMVLVYEMSPRIEHYGCLVDLFGRAGFLEEAYELIKGLSLRGDAATWRALLSACRVYGNVEFGQLARQSLAALGDEHPSDDILLSNTYTLEGRWGDVVRMQELNGEKKMMNKKEAGRSSIEI